MAITHVTAIRNEKADIVLGHIDDGTGVGKVQVTSVVDDYAPGNILVEIPLSVAPAFPAAAAGAATANNAPFEGIAGNTGTALQFRVTDSDDNEVFRGTVTETGMGGDFQLTSTLITTLDPVRINSFTYTDSV